MWAYPTAEVIFSSLEIKRTAFCHIVGPIESPFKPLCTILLWCLRGLRGSLIAPPWCRDTPASRRNSTRNYFGRRQSGTSRGKVHKKMHFSTGRHNPGKLTISSLGILLNAACYPWQNTECKCVNSLGLQWPVWMCCFCERFFFSQCEDPPGPSWQCID